MNARSLWLPFAAFVVLGCSSASDIPRSTSTVECRDPSGQVIACSTTLAQAGGFSLTLTGRSCDATNDEIQLTQPVAETITTDGCSHPIGTQWRYGVADATSGHTAPYPAGTAVNLVIVADQFNNPPGLRVTAIPNTTPTAWRLEFEDGADTDFNDIVLELRQLPAPSEASGT